MYNLKYHKRVLKFLLKQDMMFKQNILDIFDDIAKNPYNTTYDIKPYKSNIKYQYRLRVGKYRFIYQIKDDELLILVIDGGSRGEIYK